VHAVADDPHRAGGGILRLGRHHPEAGSGEVGLHPTVAQRTRAGEGGDVAQGGDRVVVERPPAGGPGYLALGAMLAIVVSVGVLRYFRKKK